MDFDYGIIGGGPAGYTVAIMLAQKGNKVVLFEKNKLGGTCLNRGCIPTKSLLHSSEIYRQTIESSNIGLEIDIKHFDFTKIVEIKNNTVEKIRKSLEFAVKNSGVIVIYENAEIINKNTIKTATSEYKCNEIILATGSKPKEIKGLESDGKFVLNSDDVLNLDLLPKSVLIIGSGAIGIEWARIFSNFGVEVNLVEMANHLIPVADIEVSKRIERIFKQKKIKIFLQDSISTIDNNVVTLKSGTTLTPDFVLSAVGREPITIENTNLPSIGDCCGEIQLAHYAIHQAKSIALGIDFNKDLVPSIIYGNPEIAWIGLREQDCNEDYQKIVLPITALGKSWCDNATEGFIKLITKDDLIYGAHIVSKEASALIHQLLIAIQNKIKISELKKVCFAHPTYSEGIFEIICRL